MKVRSLFSAAFFFPLSLSFSCFPSKEHRQDGKWTFSDEFYRAQLPAGTSLCSASQQPDNDDLNTHSQRGWGGTPILSPPLSKQTNKHTHHQTAGWNWPNSASFPHESSTRFLHVCNACQLLLPTATLSPLAARAGSCVASVSKERMRPWVSPAARASELQGVVFLECAPQRCSQINICPPQSLCWGSSRISDFN